MHSKIVNSPPPKMPRSFVSLLLLFVVNLMPIIGFVYYNWSVFELLTIYGIEIIVAGLLNVIRIKIVKKKFLQMGGASARDIQENLYVSLFLLFYVPCSLVYFYGLYSASVSYSLEAPSIFVIALAFIAFTVSHGFSLWYNFFGNKEYIDFPVRQLIIRPFSRILLLNSTILLFGFMGLDVGMDLFEASSLTVMYLAIIKLWFDGVLHMWEHDAFRFFKRTEYFVAAIFVQPLVWFLLIVLSILLIDRTLV